MLDHMRLLRIVTFFEERMDAQLVIWALPVAIRMQVHFQLLMLVINLHTVPSQTDALSLFNVRDRDDRAELVFDLDRLADRSDAIGCGVDDLPWRVVRRIRRRELHKVVHDARTCGVDW